MDKALYSKVTSKGQVTIPHGIREQFGLSSSSKIKFVNKGEYIMVIPLNRSAVSLKGILPPPEYSLSCDEMNDIIREKSK